MGVGVEEANCVYRVEAGTTKKMSMLTEDQKFQQQEVGLITQIRDGHVNNILYGFSDSGALPF